MMLLSDIHITAKAEILILSLYIYIFVVPEYRRHGYGTAMAIFLTNEILRRGFNEAHLACKTGNDNALHIYEKIGYKKQYTDYWAIKKFDTKE